MAPSALPFIGETAYPQFQRMIPELRDISYEEWTEDLRKAAAYRKPRNGSTEIPVSPDEFDEWLTTNKNTAHLELLWAYVEGKAAGFAFNPDSH